MNSFQSSFIDSFQQNRRNFIKNLSIGSGTILLSPLLSNCSTQYKSDLYNNFLNPKADAKPFFRWWWNGNRLSKDEILRELNLMKDAGIGGIEINPVEMPEQADNLIGGAVDWLSDEWIDFLEFTIKEAKKLGMVTDLIVGTGWPFGGEFLGPEETIQGLNVEVVKLNGPKRVEIPLPKPSGDFNFEIRKITLFPLKIKSINEGKDISFDPNKNRITIDVPSGKHELHILTWRNNFRTVMHGAPGGAGPVLDHFNKAAVEKYLNHMSDRIKQKTGKSKLEGIRAMFCDSIELNGANWTHGFARVFKERRRYDILPYLPLLLRKEVNVDPAFEDELKRARYDYSCTLAELFTESFIIPFHSWCNENGALSRYQAYGHPWLYTDLIDGYLIPDIPEGDQWLFNGGWQPYADVDEIRYAIWNKYASSAGHLANRKIISSEAMTNTSGVFKASLKYIKQATDLNIATGVNHQVLHGFNYSPPDAEFPGWIRYGCYFNENNPWWQYMPEWSRYSSRLSQIFQDSLPISQVAIMGPTQDIWSDHGLDRNPFNLEPWYLHAIWQALNHLGFCSDYVNSNLLKNARLERGSIIIGAMKYEIVLLCDVETITSDVAIKIDELTRQGARIVIIGKKPRRSPHMIGAPKNDGIIIKSMETAFNAGISTAPSPENKLQKTPELLMNWIGQLMNNCGITPNVEISSPGPKLFQIQHQKESADILFLANVDRNEDFVSAISFGEKTKYATRWDPETGEKSKLNQNDFGQITINLHPLESMLIVFDSLENSGANNARKITEPKEGKEITGTWEVTLKQVDNSSKSIKLNKLIPINELSDFENFGGEVSYKTQFENDNTNFSILTIDEVHETAEVKLNGNNLGLSWYGNNKFEINGSLRQGKNNLEIKVTTLLANYCSSLKNNKTTQYWTSRYKDKTPVQCGLVGTIMLI